MTEYPSVINSFQRFNIMPEVLIAAKYRAFVAVCEWLDIELLECWKVSRPNPLSPVQSCEGLADPNIFYVTCAFLMAGFSAALIFLSGAVLSRSFLGGFISVSCFFFNHSEGTRVMWTPPLRETFAFPFFLLTNLVITWILRKPKKAITYQAIYLGVCCAVYLSFWQLSQYTVAVSLLVVYALYTLEAVPAIEMIVIFVGIATGFFNGLLLMFMNKLLISSILASAVAAVFILYVFLENIFDFVPFPYNKTIQFCFIFFSTAATKLELSSWLGEDEDSHIFNLLKSKFTNYSNFHTKLYTCADEFDFLPAITYFKLSYTLLLPLVCIIVIAVLYDSVRKLFKNMYKAYWVDQSFTDYWQGVDTGVLYNVIMLFVYCFMAAIVMRLKLFMVPQLCIVASLIATKTFWLTSLIGNTRHYIIIFGILGLMSIQGIRNIQEQRAIVGEYSDPNLEELLEWTNSHTKRDAVFAGTMPTMGNLMLSTGRPIVNHPHYETKEMRFRTWLVYTVFSRSPAVELYEILNKMGVNYIVLDRRWCFKTSAAHKPGCAIIDLWDEEAPSYKKNNKPPLCPILFEKDPVPFERVFKNDEYVVLQVPSKFVQVQQPKSLKS